MDISVYKKYFFLMEWSKWNIYTIKVTLKKRIVLSLNNIFLLYNCSNLNQYSDTGEKPVSKDQKVPKLCIKNKTVSGALTKQLIVPIKIA